jgi:hypothetical protein
MVFSESPWNDQAVIEKFQIPNTCSLAPSVKKTRQITLYRNKEIRLRNSLHMFSGRIFYRFLHVKSHKNTSKKELPFSVFLATNQLEIK